MLDTLKKYKEAIAWSIEDLKGISPSVCMHKILLEENARSSIEHQRRLNPVIKEVVRKEVLKWLNAGFIYAISDSPWVSPIHVVPKKGGFTVIKNEKNELIPTRTVTGWRVCIDYKKLNTATRKDHYPLPFIDQMLDRLARHSHYCFLDGYSGYNQIAIAQRIRRNQHLHVLMVPLPLEGCHLDYVMLLPPFKDVWCLYFLIWWKRLWKYSWMISQYMDPVLKIV